MLGLDLAPIDDVKLGPGLPKASSLGLLTPADVQHGLAERRTAERATVLAAAYAAHPERFPAGLPHPTAGPVEVWITQDPSD